MGQLDPIEKAVKKIKDVAEGARTLVNSLADRLRAAAEDPAKVTALADELNATAESLAQAVAANTIADPNAGGGSIGTPTPPAGETPQTGDLNPPPS